MLLFRYFPGITAPVVHGRSHPSVARRYKPECHLFWFVGVPEPVLTGFIGISEKYTLAVTAAKPVTAFRVLTVAINLSRLAAWTMNSNVTMRKPQINQLEALP
jgi:hypothetical protein